MATKETQDLVKSGNLANLGDFGKYKESRMIIDLGTMEFKINGAT